MNTVRRKLRHAMVAGLILAPGVLSAQALVSTGTGAVGTQDVSWQVGVAGINGGALANAFVLDRTPQQAGVFRWIAPTASGTLPGGAADGFLTRFTYLFQTTFNGATISGATYQCALDDTFISVMLNGTIVPGAGCDQYNIGSTFNLSGFTTGTNTLTFNTTGNGVTDGLAVHFITITPRVTATPEPASLVLLATGLAGVFGGVRRKIG